MVGTDRPLAVTNQPARILKIDCDGSRFRFTRTAARDDISIRHEIAVDKNNSIFTAEVLGWHAQTFLLK